MLFECCDVFVLSHHLNRSELKMSRLKRYTTDLKVIQSSSYLFLTVKLVTFSGCNLFNMLLLLNCTTIQYTRSHKVQLNTCTVCMCSFIFYIAEFAYKFLTKNLCPFAYLGKNILKRSVRYSETYLVSMPRIFVNIWSWYINGCQWSKVSRFDKLHFVFAMIFVYFFICLFRYEI